MRHAFVVRRALTESERGLLVLKYRRSAGYSYQLTGSVSAWILSACTRLRCQSDISKTARILTTAP
jgi:hypothetical protein